MNSAQLDGLASDHRMLAPDPNVEQSLPRLFERVAEQHASRIALGSGAWQPSYEELNERANILAHSIIHRGGRQTDRVALLMRHDTPLIAGMLGILKAGRVVVALNAKDPLPRLRLLLRHAEAGLILTDDDNAPLARQLAADFCDWVSCDDIRYNAFGRNPSLEISPDATAFLIYTSGTTGEPKAVMQSHRYTTSNAVKHNGIMEFVPDDRLTHFASLSGTQGVSTAWSALAHGAALCPFPVIEKGVTGLANWMIEREITVYRSSASLFRHFMSTLDDGVCFTRMRIMRVASELATSDDFRYFQKHVTDRCRFVHCLSSTETGNITQLRLLRSDSVAEGRLATGAVSDGVKILLLDDNDREVAFGERGEIVVVSRVLADGYWRNETLTKEKFSEGPAGSGLRMFRTGDLGRFKADGMLEHLGRKDARVKIRGFRVEPSEVEAALRRLPEVAQAVVMAIEKPQRGTQLVAFLISKTGRELAGSEIRRRLQFELPAHMIPIAFLYIDRLPLTPHSKIDRQKLRQIHDERLQRKTVEQPATETEILIARIWAETFDLFEVGRYDDFFDLGGDSLSGAVITARIHDALGVDVNLDALARTPRLDELAAALDSARRSARTAETPSLVRVSRDAPLPLSLVQERIWNFSQSPEGCAAYTMARSHRIVGPLDPELLQRCISELFRRHEILRTAFRIEDGAPVQVVGPPAPVEIPVVDLSESDRVDDRLAEITDREAARAFDLTTAPLVRFTLIRVGANEHILLRVAHHLIGDGLSWSRFNKELVKLYEAHVAGDAPPPPDSTVPQYADYAARQRRALHKDGPRYRDVIQWWQRQFSCTPPTIELPFKRREPRTGLDPAEGYFQWSLDPQVNLRLSDLARKTGATFFQIRLAAFIVLLASKAGIRDIAIGTYFQTQGRMALQNMLGLFANMTPLVLSCPQHITFHEILHALRTALSETDLNSDIPYEDVYNELSARNIKLPDIRVIFSTGADHSAERFANLRMVWEPPRTQRMPWGFTMRIDERVENNCAAAFDAGIYAPEGVRAFVDQYRQFLDVVSRHADLSIETLHEISSLQSIGP